MLRWRENPFDTPFGHRIETTLLALCTLMTSVDGTTIGIKASNSLPWRQWRKNSHFNAFWGRNYVIVIFFTHYLWETMKWNQSFNLIKIYIYWRILSDQLVILISSRGRTTRFQIKCIARPGSTIYTDILSLSLLS